MDINRITRILILVTPLEDAMVWITKKKGHFFVQATYWFVVSCKSLQQTRPSTSSSIIPLKFWKFIWFKGFPLRPGLWLWRATKNKSPTKLNLQQKRVNVNPLCYFCSFEVESLIHLLQKYSIIRHLCLDTMKSSIVDKLWSKFANHHVDFWLNLWRSMHAVECVVSALFFCVIWENRNKILFCNTKFCYSVSDKIWKYLVSKWGILHGRAEGIYLQLMTLTVHYMHTAVIVSISSFRNHFVHVRYLIFSGDLTLC